MRLTLKSKIWMTVLAIVFMFAFFILFYFPAQQEKYMIRNYKSEVENLAKTVALGTKIALTEQNFEGVETAMDFVKSDVRLNYIALVQVDTIWNITHRAFTLRQTVFKTYPEKITVNPDEAENIQNVIKRAPFSTPVMNGAVILSFSKKEIIKSLKKSRNTSLFVSVIVFVIGIVLGFWLAKHISVPVLELRDAALRVGEGDRDQQVRKRSGDEIGELSEAFNKMVKDLTVAEEKVKATQQQLIQSEKMASLGELTAGIAHEIQNPLNFINNFSDLSAQMIEEYFATDDEKEKAELLALIKDNVEKINHHGTRADSIVKGMLLHSRTEGVDKKPTDINLLTEEAYNLAYHSLRANNPSISGTLEKHFSPELPEVNLNQQRILRVLINLLNNAFFAVHERAMKEGKDSAYVPVVSVSTNYSPEGISISIRDNGSGIPESIKDKIFQPFFSTKKTGEGTGLGLSISYEIIAIEHQGKIAVESHEGEGTEFVITLPV